MSTDDWAITLSFCGECASLLTPDGFGGQCENCGKTNDEEDAIQADFSDEDARRFLHILGQEPNWITLEDGSIRPKEERSVN